MIHIRACHVCSQDVRELSALQLSGLSARERNRAKRKAKLMARRASKDADTPERWYMYIVCVGVRGERCCGSW